MTLESATNLSTGLTGTTPSTFTIAKKGGTHSTVLSLLKTFGETNVLSSPRITVADKEEAKILVGSKEVYVTSDVTTTSGGTYHTTDHVQFVDVGVALSVTPSINKTGFVTMRIKPEVSATDATKTVELTNPDGSTRTIVPYVTTSEAETTVIIKDGTTLIIGGLMKDTIIDHEEKVPFLGDIPVIGKLFTTTGKSKEKTELVIFLTPHIIEGDRITEEAYSYMDEWREKAQEKEIERPEWPEVKLPKSVEPVKPRRPRATWTPLLGAQSQGTGIERDGETPYEEYYLRVREEINNIASEQDVGGFSGEVELQFTLDRDGFLTRSPVVLNKPDMKLVRAAVNCVKLASPFPPFPRDMRKEKAEFYVLVKYE